MVSYIIFTCPCSLKVDESSRRNSRAEGYKLPCTSDDPNCVFEKWKCKPFWKNWSFTWKRHLSIRINKWCKRIIYIMAIDAIIIWTQISCDSCDIFERNIKANIELRNRMRLKKSRRGQVWNRSGFKTSVFCWVCICQCLRWNSS